MKEAHGKTLLYILIILIPVLAFLVYNYVFNIYEVDYKTTDTKIYADGASTFTIEVVPVNGLGFKVPFRNVRTVFTFERGKELIDVILEDRENGKLVIRSQQKTGEVEIIVKPEKSLFPTKFVVHILPNYA
ncbi:MAG: hypothetical protein HUU54_14295 [Ignavibacteriaceae bacterium]|nr:hypothetical protein [Ignavibacteriaceae bacterium]